MSNMQTMKSCFAALAAAVASTGIVLHSVADQTVTDDTTLTADVSGKLTVENGASVRIAESLTVGSYAINSGTLTIAAGKTFKATDTASNYLGVDAANEGSYSHTGNIGAIVLEENAVMEDTSNNEVHLFTSRLGSEARIVVGSGARFDMGWKYIKANGNTSNSNRNGNNRLVLDISGQMTVGEILTMDWFYNGGASGNPRSWPTNMVVNLHEGGTLSIRSIQRGWDTALALFNFDGGTLKFRWNDANFLHDDRPPAEFHFVTGSRGVFNTDGNNVNLTSANRVFLSGGGAMTKAGNGTLTINASLCDASDFTGDIYLTGGTLNFPIVADGIARKVYFQGGALAVPENGTFVTTRNGGSVEFVSVNRADIKLVSNGNAKIANDGVVVECIGQGDTMGSIVTEGTFVSGGELREKIVVDGGTRRISAASATQGYEILNGGTLELAQKLMVVNPPAGSVNKIGCGGSTGTLHLLSGVELTDTDGGDNRHVDAARLGGTAAITVEGGGYLNLGNKWLYASCNDSNETRSYRGHTTLTLNNGTAMIGEIHAADWFWNGGGGLNPLTEWPEVMAVNINGGHLYTYHINVNDSAIVNVNFNGGKLWCLTDGNFKGGGAGAMRFNMVSGIAEIETYNRANVSLHGGGPCYMTGSGAIRKTGAGTLMMDGCDTSAFTGDVHIANGVLNLPIVADGVVRKVYFEGGALTVPQNGTFATSRNGGSVEFISVNGNPIRLIHDGSAAIGSGVVYKGTVVVLTGESSNITLWGEGLAVDPSAGVHLAKFGAGTAYATGANAYSGDTVAESGAYVVQGASGASPKYFRLTMRNRHGSTSQVSKFALYDSAGRNWCVLEKGDNNKNAYELAADRFSCEQDMPQAGSSNELIEKMFDDSVDTKWCMNTEVAKSYHIVMRLADDANPIVGFNLFTGGDDNDYPSRAISDIRLESSADGRVWQIASEKTDIPQIGKSKAAYFDSNVFVAPIARPHSISISAKFFRFTFSNTEFGSSQFAWLKLCSADGTIQSTDLADAGVGVGAASLSPGTYSRVSDFLQWGDGNFANVFDESADTKFGGATNGQIVLRLKDDAAPIVWYDVMSGGDDNTWGRRLTGFKLEASYDGSNWHTVSDVTVTDRTLVNNAWYSGGAGYHFDYFYPGKTSNATDATIPAESMVEVKPGAKLSIETAMTISKLRINLDDEKSVVNNNAAPGQIYGFNPAANGTLELVYTGNEPLGSEVTLGLDFEYADESANEVLKTWSCTLNGLSSKYRLVTGEGARNSKLVMRPHLLIMVY